MFVLLDNDYDFGEHILRLFAHFGSLSARELYKNQC